MINASNVSIQAKDGAACRVPEKLLREHPNLPDTAEDSLLEDRVMRVSIAPNSPTSLNQLRLRLLPLVTIKFCGRGSLTAQRPPDNDWLFRDDREVSPCGGIRLAPALLPFL